MNITKATITLNLADAINTQPITAILNGKAARVYIHIASRRMHNRTTDI